MAEAGSLPGLHLEPALALSPALMRLLAITLLFALFAITGCKGSCRKLSERLCECEQNNLLREACLRRASGSDSRQSPTESEELACAELLEAETCNCNRLNTAEGKVACGLARPGPVNAPQAE